MQLYEGIIKSWKTDKGFGFIQPDEGGKDIFVHIRDLQHANYQPQPGDRVCYKIVADKDGKTRAYDAFIKGQEISDIHRKKTFKHQSQLQDKTTKRKDWIKMPFIWAIAILPFLFSSWLIKQQLNFLPFIIYLIMSLITFFAYAIDKTKAHKNEWRTQESTLHLFGLLGGWPGALITQRVIRHKNRKTTFQVVFWIIVFIHLVVWIDVLFFNNNGMLCQFYSLCNRE